VEISEYDLEKLKSVGFKIRGDSALLSKLVSKKEGVEIKLIDIKFIKITEGQGDLDAIGFLSFLHKIRMGGPPSYKSDKMYIIDIFMKSKKLYKIKLGNIDKIGVTRAIKRLNEQLRSN
jgi:hypothetical protein